MEMIFPADNPRITVLSGHGMRIRLEQVHENEMETGNTVSKIRLYSKQSTCNENDDKHTKCSIRSPGGVTVEFLSQPSETLNIIEPQYDEPISCQHDDSAWVTGRAGMQYRDLVPSRLGGAMIASHIRIEEAGVVPDVVHHHSVTFQMIFCYRGWVDVVYQHQGPTIRLTPGDLVIQPPGIRHRVLEASAGLEVIEVGLPAEHLTQVDHDV